MANALGDVLTRAVCWTAGMIEGLVLGVVGHRGIRGGSAGLGRVDAGLEQPYRELGRAILGRNRRQIARVLGIPPTACVGFGVEIEGTLPTTYWDATTWYYPFDQRERKAIAIRFVGDRAREVEFIGAP